MIFMIHVFNFYIIFFLLIFIIIIIISGNWEAPVSFDIQRTISSPTLVYTQNKLHLFGCTNKHFDYFGSLDPLTLQFNPCTTIERNSFPKPPARIHYALTVYEPEINSNQREAYLLLHGGEIPTWNREHESCLLNDFYRFNFCENRWEDITTIVKVKERKGHSITILDDKLYLFGGQLDSEGKKASNNIHVFDLLKENWVNLPHLCPCEKDNLISLNISSISKYNINDHRFMNQHYPSARGQHSATVLEDRNSILIYGGYNNETGALSDSWILYHDSFPRLRWIKVSLFNDKLGSISRFGHQSTMLGHRLLILGGYSQHKPQNNIFEIHFDAWEAKLVSFHKISNLDPTIPLNECCICLIQNKLLLFNQSARNINILNLGSNILKPQQIKIEKRIGQGTFAFVYKSLLQPFNIPVAYKLLTCQNLKQDNDVLQEFDHEVDIMQRLQNRNVLSLLYIVSEPPHIGFVTEYCRFGSLRRVIKNRHFLFKYRIKLLMDAAAGMDHLHSMRPSIMHRDLKPENILLFGSDRNNLIAKISDFGLSKVKQHTMTITGVAGTPFYIAPEVFKGEQIGNSSDVYSFAIIMWEVMTGQFMSEHFGESSFSQQLIKGRRPPILIPKHLRYDYREGNNNNYNNDTDNVISNINQDKALNIYIELMKECWDDQYTHRPSFLNILNRLKQIYDILLPSSQNINKNDDIVVESQKLLKYIPQIYCSDDQQLPIFILGGRDVGKNALRKQYMEGVISEDPAKITRVGMEHHAKVKSVDGVSIKTAVWMGTSFKMLRNSLHLIMMQRIYAKKHVFKPFPVIILYDPYDESIFIDVEIYLQQYIVNAAVVVIVANWKLQPPKIHTKKKIISDAEGMAKAQRYGCLFASIDVSNTAHVNQFITAVLRICFGNISRLPQFSHFRHDISSLWNGNKLLD
eukprot:gb/GECH01010343.1/.p1 GENE.gb/GECH01010343.1/~~gb/GECH01010343.1/.p1  ORF type:complete len:919 (+),score=111.87 gb/GECH01010343.1/:1-2757(+)